MGGGYGRTAPVIGVIAGHQYIMRPVTGSGLPVRLTVAKFALFAKSSRGSRGKSSRSAVSAVLQAERQRAAFDVKPPPRPKVPMAEVLPIAKLPPLRTKPCEIVPPFAKLSCR